MTNRAPRPVALVLVCFLLLVVFGGVRPVPVAAAGGTVRGWGNNGNGQLGDGTTDYRVAPVGAVGVDNITAVAVGGAWSLVLRSDGTAWSWGFNTVDQLGDGTLIQRTTAVRVIGLSDVVSVAAGGSHGLALLRDGTVWAWGSNDSGALGGGTIDRDPHPQARAVPGLPPVVAIAAGGAESLALTADGAVWSWGYGQVRNGAGLTSATPTIVEGLPPVIAMQSGSARLALTASGEVWAWGDNSNGERGNGSTFVAALPGKVIDLPPIITISSGGYHSLAVDRDGRAWAWGSNSAGQLGLGTQDYNPHPTPVRLEGIERVRAISGGDNHSIALTEAGTVLGWGGTGLNGNPNRSYVPIPIAGLSGVSTLDAGSYHSLALVAGAEGSPSSSPSATPLPSASPAPSASPVASPPASPVASPLPAPVPGQAFVDVPPGYWAYGQINWFAIRGFTTGCDTDAQGRRLYCPERSVTRAEMAVFINRTLGYTAPATPVSQRFSDVPTDYWAYAHIEQFAQLGITTGCGGTEFCPDRKVTRAEMAAFLTRALKQDRMAPATPTFADVPTNHPQYDYIEALVALGVTTGCGDPNVRPRTYCPGSEVTRAEMAVFIVRAYP